MCSTPNTSRPPPPPPEVEEPLIELGTAKKPSDIRKRGSTGISSLRTGLNVGGGGAGLTIPAK